MSKTDYISAHFAGARLSGQPTSAKEARFYRDPAANVRFGKRVKGETMDRMSDREQADSLLMEWYRWSKAWRPNLGAPRVSPSCRGYRGDEKHADYSETTEEESNEWLHQNEMKAVDFCVGAIEVPMQQAIGTEMRNREVKAKVWRDPGNRTFAAALDAVLPHMRKHRDLMALFN